MTTPAGPNIATACGFGSACLRAVNGVAAEVGPAERAEILIGNTRQWFHPECRVMADNTPRMFTVTVGTTPTLLAEARHRRSSITIQNPSNWAVSIGYGAHQATSLTISNGTRIPAGGSITEESYTGPIYGVAAQSFSVSLTEVGS